MSGTHGHRDTEQRRRIRLSVIGAAAAVLGLALVVYLFALLLYALNR